MCRLPPLALLPDRIPSSPLLWSPTPSSLGRLTNPHMAKVLFLNAAACHCPPCRPRSTFPHQEHDRQLPSATGNLRSSPNPPKLSNLSSSSIYPEGKDGHVFPPPREGSTTTAPLLSAVSSRQGGMGGNVRCGFPRRMANTAAKNTIAYRPAFRPTGHHPTQCPLRNRLQPTLRLGAA